MTVPQPQSRKAPHHVPTVPHALADEIRPGQSLELLKELHILTRDGKLNQDSRRKLKQVNHLCQFIEKLLHELEQPPNANANANTITLADHGAGKSYLGFILYDLFFRQHSESHIYGIETRAELVQKSCNLATRLNFDRMTFLNLTVAQSAQSTACPDRIDLVTALHACDTATDDAIAFGLQKHARFMVLVPCCQAEVARLLNQNKAKSLSGTPLSELWRPPSHTRNGQSSHQCAALPVFAGLWLPCLRDRTGWLGAQLEKRIDRSPLHWSTSSQCGRSFTCLAGRIWPDTIASHTLYSAD